MAIMWDGKGMNYNTGYSLVAIKIICLAGGLTLAVAFILQLIVFFLDRSRRIQDYEKVVAEEPTSKITFLLKEKQTGPLCLEAVAMGVFWLGLLLLSLNFPVLSGFGHIPTVASIFLMIIVYIIGLLYSIFRLTYYQEGKFIERFKAVIQKKRWALIVVTTILMFLSIFLPLLLQRSCLCFNTMGYGNKMGSLYFSTQMTRAQWLPKHVCPESGLCHVYTTLPSSTSTSVYINIHTGTDLNQIAVNLILNQQSNHTTLTCEKQPFPDDIEERGERNVYACLAMDLQPITTYTVQIYNANEPLLETTYRTLPAYGAGRQLQIVFGGDFGYFENGVNLINNMADFDPDVVLIGGDVSYDDAMNSCYYSWDLMLSTYETSMQKINRLVPLILAVGNHDVGLNSLSGANITVSNRGPLYFSYFPMQFESETDRSIVKVPHRKTFYYHFLGNFMLITLDSGYLYGYEGQQTVWLEETLKLYYQKYNIIVQYHNPMYPVCWTNGTTKSNPEQLMKSREIWQPIFERYGVLGAFENHVHHFKRTFPILGGKPNLLNSTGVVYFGDGCLGLGEKDCQSQYQTSESFNKGYFAAYDYTSSNHFWVLSAYPNKTVEFKAFSPQEQLMQDSYYKVNVDL